MKEPVIGLKPTSPVTADVGMLVTADCARITKLPAVPRLTDAGPRPRPPAPVPAPDALGTPAPDMSPSPPPQPASNAPSSKDVAHRSGLNKPSILFISVTFSFAPVRHMCTADLLWVRR